MRITDVQGHALSSPIDPPQERRFHGGSRRLRKRDVVLVVVETADGRQGFATAGASSSAMREFFEDDSLGTFGEVVNGPVADALVGETIEEIPAAHARLRKTDLPARLQREAISAIDVALYDLRGKELGAPVHELLAEEYGTQSTTHLPLYASAGMYMEPEGYVDQALVLEDLGFTGYKYRPGIGPARDREVVKRLADALTDMAFMLDSHTWWKLRESYDPETVRELVAYAADHGAHWVEEPVEPDDYEGYVELAETGAALAGGESEPSFAGLIDLAETGAVDFLQGDVRHHEGFSGCQEAIEHCRGRDMEFVPHNFGTWLGLVANAHLVAAAPEVSLLEYPVFENDPALAADPDPGMYPFDLAFDLLDGEPEITDGRLAVPEGPGLGIDVNLDVVEEYPFVEGAWTEFRYDKA
ncbi:mandelate racemase/muconate lactonizing enzyme family protein [Halococcus agarilyticus]|uniref:mandelate racemase/muconate lactonizing enzyme family protein n=1 Tax=Halococcus agarilyticus TaxID=1232219 RepID=UPI0006778C13|nr:mandelate racemase/muconate lactonizing enzyme family protein [Halococcus agarilyticus]